MDHAAYTGNSRKRPHLDVTNSPHPIIKMEPVDSDWGRQVSTNQGSNERLSRRGQVRCGHCKTRRASVCCMEETCVIHAVRKWNMTTMLVCAPCDDAIHNNPVMSDHIRTSLLIRGFTYHDYVPPSETETNPAAADKELEVTPPELTDQSIVISTNYDDPASEVEGDDVVFCPNNSQGDSVDINSYDLEEVYTPYTISVSNKGLPREAVSLNKLELVHERYAHVLENHLVSLPCSLTDTFRQTNVPRQTLLDHLGIAELKIVDAQRYEEFLEAVAQKRVSSRVVDMERECRKVIKEHCKETVLRLRGTKLLPLKVNVYN